MSSLSHLLVAPVVLPLVTAAVLVLLGERRRRLGAMIHVAATLAGERQREVRLAVAGLREPYREVVALRFFGEMSLDEIAQVTKRPLNTVKTHLRRGLERLRPVLGREAAA